MSMPPNSHLQKKEMMFPPDSIESMAPVLAKRKRLTKNDVGMYLCRPIWFKTLKCQQVRADISRKVIRFIMIHNHHL